MTLLGFLSFSGFDDGNQSCDTRSNGFGVKFLLLKMSASSFYHDRKSGFMLLIVKVVEIMGHVYLFEFGKFETYHASGILSGHGKSRL